MIGAHTGLPWPAIYHRRGGGTPKPIPTILIDFQNADYRVNNSVVALNTLAIEDSDNWFTFNTADIVPGVGYSVTGSQGPLLIGEVVTAMVVGASVVFDINLDDLTTAVLLDLFKKWTFDPDIRLQMGASLDNITEVTDFVDAAVSSTPALGTGNHLVAAKFTNGSIAISASGESDVTQAISLWSTTPDGVGVSTSGGGLKTIRSIKFYSPPQLPLSALSS